MRKSLSFLLFALFSHAVFSQESSLKGIVRDTAEKKNLSHAVITLLDGKDSVLAKYGRSDSHGAFTIAKLKPGDYVLMITYPKFADFTEKVTVPPSGLDMGVIALTPKSVLLKEVVIRTNAAIRVKGDTTEFTADSFKVREGATVEELLKQLPGMSVNSKGEITSQGKRVDKVLVDGEEFFGEDPTIATQNIGAKAVDKVQVYDTKTEQDQLKGIGASGDGNKTINIKLKESAKKGYFGRLEGSTDFNKLANAKAMFNLFRGSKKVSVYGTKSNINTGSLGWEDRNKLGIENDYEYDEISGFYYSFGDGDNEFNDWSLRGIPNAWSAGGLFSNKWNEEKNKLNLSYLYNRLGAENTDRKISQTIAKDTTFYNRSVVRSDALSQRHTLNGKYEWKIDSLASIKYTAIGSYRLKDSYTETQSEALDEYLDSVNVNFNTKNMSSTKRQLDNVLTYRQMFNKKDRLMIATFRLGLVEDDQDTKLYSLTDHYSNHNTLDSTTIVDQMKIFDGKSTSAGAKVTFNEPLTKEWNLVAEYSFNYNNSSSHRNSFNNDGSGKYTDLDTVFSNNADLTASANSGTITARYVGQKLRFVFGTGLSAIQLNLNDLDEKKKTKYNFTGFTPQMQFGYKMKAQTGVSIYYRGNTIQPSLTQLQPLRDNTDPINIYIGNPNLKVGFNHNMGVNYNDFKVLKGQYIYTSISVNIIRNAIAQKSTTEQGINTFMPVNVNGNYNWFWWGIWQSGQGDKKWNHEIQPQANGGRSKGFLNNRENTNTYITASVSYRIRYSIQDKYNFSMGPLLRKNLSKSSFNPDQKVNYWSYGGRADGYVMLPGKFELSSDVDVNLNQKTAVFTGRNIIVWNAEFSRKFTKKKNLKVGVIAHDILNQNIGFERNINSYTISERRYDRLARYFLLSVSWTFDKMPGKN